MPAKPDDHTVLPKRAERLRGFLADPEKSRPTALLARVILKSTSTTQRIRLSRPVSIVGRTSECDVVLRASDVSKQHCRIIIDADSVTIEDLGSANGTFVNGQKIRKAQLEDRDRVGFADHEFKVRIALPKADE